MSIESFNTEAGKVKEILGSLSPELFPENLRVSRMEREDFQSADFAAAGLHLEPGRSDEADRHIYIIAFESGQKLVLLSGKAHGDNPYELPWQGADLRPTKPVAFFYDGEGNITEIPLYTEGRAEHKGEAGKPETLLYHLRRLAGRKVNEEIILDLVPQASP